jgi:hypothetical protein
MLYVCESETECPFLSVGQLLIFICIFHLLLCVCVRLQSVIKTPTAHLSFCYGILYVRPYVQFGGCVTYECLFDELIQEI